MPSLPEPNVKNRTLYICDNLRVMRGINSESIDLIATDPPFNTKRLYNAPMGSKAANQQFDDRWKWDEVTNEWHDLIATDHPAIKELIEAAVVIESGSIEKHTGKIDTGKTKNSVAAFLAWMAPRLIEMHRILKPTGSLYLHCNREANAYLRLLLDAIFGRNNFGSEIIWRKLPKNCTRSLGNEHDTIFYYYKHNKKYTFNIVRKPYMKGHVEEHYEKEGERYRYTVGGNILTGQGATDGPSCESWRGFDPKPKDRHWAIPKHYNQFMDTAYLQLSPIQKLEALYQKGFIEIKPGNAWPTMVRYLDERDGVVLNDIWAYQPYTEGTVYGSKKGIEEEVKWLPPRSLVRTEWKTQKPVGLYERIIKISSNEGDLVLDPFCGCATTCVAAERQRRNWIGIDIDPEAETVTNERLQETSGLDQHVGLEYVTVQKTSPRRTDIEYISADKMRLLLWKKQGQLCGNPYCTLKHVARHVDLHLDHVIPKSRGGSDDILNRIGLCGNCNSRKGRKAWGSFLDDERAKQAHPVVGK